MAEETDTRKAHEDGFWVKSWFVEPMLNRVSRDDETIQVEPKVMEVLLCMAKQPGKTVTKEQFMDTVWTDTVVTDDVLSRCISELRKIFGDDSRDPEYVETIRKVGYRLIAPVTVPNISDGTRASISDAMGSDLASGAFTEEQTATSEDHESLKTLIRRLSSDLEVLTSDGRARRMRPSGNGDRRLWLFAIIGVVFVVAALATVLVLRSPSTPSSQQPLSAIPFTSFPGQEFDPALSPDGQQVVFTWEGEDDDGYRNLYLMQEVAEEPLRLTTAEANDWGPTWSPDGRLIAFVRSTDEQDSIYLVSSIGGSERRIASFSSRNVQGVAWSPDTSRRVLAISLQDRPHRTYSLYQLSLSSDSLIPLTRPPSYSIGDTNPVYSPDGTRIAFMRTFVDDVQDVFVVPSNGGTARRLTSDSTVVSGLDWLPGGKHIIFASHRGGTSGLWRVPAKGGSPTWITTASEGTSLHHPSVARHGKRLAYTQQASEVNLWKVGDPTDYSRLTTTRLLSSTQWDSDPSISPDGTHIAFASRRSGHPEIWTARADGSTPQQITSFEGPLTHSPSWSHDGEQIAFVSRQQGSSDVFIVRAGGGPPQRLTTSSAEDLMPRWSHDGTALYLTSNRTGTWESWRVPVQGDSAVQVTQGGGLAAQEGPDGSTLYFVRPDTSGIWAVPLSDTTQFPIPVTPPFIRADSSTDLLAQNTLPANVDTLKGIQRDVPWNTLGDTIAYPDSIVVPERVAAGLLPSYHASWVVGQRGIYFLQPDGNSAVLSLYRFSTQQVTSLFLLEDVSAEGGLAASPNGDWFLHTRTERHASDILLVEEFQP